MRDRIVVAPHNHWSGWCTCRKDKASFRHHYPLQRSDRIFSPLWLVWIGKVYSSPIFLLFKSTSNVRTEMGKSRRTDIRLDILYSIQEKNFFRLGRLKVNNTIGEQAGVIDLSFCALIAGVSGFIHDTTDI